MALVWRATFIDEAMAEVAPARRAKSEPPARACSSSDFDAEREYVASLEQKAHELTAPKTQRKLQLSPSRSRAGSSKSTKSTASTTCSALTPTRCSTLCSDAGVSAWEASFPPSPSSGPASPVQQPVPTARCLRFGAVDMGPLPAGRVFPGTASCQAPESLPSTPASRRVSTMSTISVETGSTCVRARAPHLSKPHRDLLKKMSFSERVALMLPMIRRHVARMHLAVDVKELLQALRSASCTHQPPCDARRTQLLSALGVLSVRALITAIAKAPDTPEWLKEGPLKDQLDCVRGMDTLVA